MEQCILFWGDSPPNTSWAISINFMFLVFSYSLHPIKLKQNNIVKPFMLPFFHYSTELYKSQYMCYILLLATGVWCLHLQSSCYQYLYWVSLLFSMLGKNSADNILKYLILIFPRKLALAFHANCPKGNICMKCQSFFSGKSQTYIINLLSTEFASREW